MTIAAGFVCTDGIVVCSDTEHTTTTSISKKRRRKIFDIRPQVRDFVVTGAGDSRLIRRVAEDLERVFRGQVDLYADDVRSRLEEILAQIHNKHIFAFYKPTDPNCPSVQILVAIRDGKQELRLFSSQETVVTMVDDYEVLGTGADLGDFIADSFYEPNQHVSVVKVIALYMIGQAKRYSQHCGGDTHIYIVDKKPVKGTVWAAWDESEIIREFQTELKPILLGCRDRNITNEEFESALARFVKGVRDIRQITTRSADDMAVPRPLDRC